VRTRVIEYGRAASQFVELTAPAAVGAPLAVLIHGGFWKSEYDAELARPLVPSLLDRGWATLVVEYRRVGDGGGYPATLEDLAAAVDLLADLDADVDLTRVVAVGHSAGGHLAAWLAARPRLPDGTPGARPRVTVSAVVAQAGVLDLRAAAADRLGDDAVVRFLGGEPEQAPLAYAAADPTAALPLGVPVLCVHGRDDDTVPLSQSTAFAERAVAAGDPVQVRLVDGDHYVVIDPAGPAWALTLDWLAEHA